MGLVLAECLGWACTFLGAAAGVFTGYGLLLYAGVADDPIASGLERLWIGVYAVTTGTGVLILLTARSWQQRRVRLAAITYLAVLLLLILLHAI